MISIDIAHDDADLLVVTENGYGKRTPVADYPRKGRGTMGVLTIRLVEARAAPTEIRSGPDATSCASSSIGISDTSDSAPRLTRPEP